ncbi:MAG: hypothetical protein Q4G66_07865 [bacterium]|nr:hypothetical protein [bacterium]
MKKTFAAGMALALSCAACAGPKVTELDAQIAMMQAETARACYAAEAAKAQARTATHYEDARDAALVIMAEGLAERSKPDPCADRGMNVYESRVKIAESQNQGAASITRSVISGAALVTGIVATADVLNNAVKNAGHNTTTSVGDNSDVKMDSSKHDTTSESMAWGDNSPSSATATPSTTRDNVTNTTTNHAPAEEGAVTETTTETATEAIASE